MFRGSQIPEKHGKRRVGRKLVLKDNKKQEKIFDAVTLCPGRPENSNTSQL